MQTQPGEQVPRVVLVSPPWTSLNEPSLGLAVLKAVLQEAGLPCRILHSNLFMLEFLRAETYTALATTYALDDFLFSGVLDGELQSKQLRLLRERCNELVALKAIDYRKHGGIPGIVNTILHLRSKVVPEWIDSQVERILQSKPTLVGFTCMFDQTIPSLAIASRLKKAAPDVMIALGGYAVRDPTGKMLLESSPWIDAVCTGEGEPSICALAHASAEAEKDLSRVPNILYRDSSSRKVVEGPRAERVDLDTVPTPDFDDFYSDVRRLHAEANIEVAVDRLPIENSRGCWWGAVHHCTFCGIHDDDLAYRFRSAETVLKTLRELSQKYDCWEFRFADYILPYQYYSTLLPDLCEMGSPYRLKCELKANITPDQMPLLARAGFVEVQPGIESFCTSVLASMDKGVTGTQNVYLLLLARRYGIVILYNILYGMPNEDGAVAEALVRAIPRLRHLDPPSTRGRVQITRYAPLQADPARFGYGPVRHEHSYELIFSERFLQQTGFDLDKYCYVYELPFQPSSRSVKAYREIDRLCDEWIASDKEHDMDLLYKVDDTGALIVYDSRAPQERRHVLNSVESSVLKAIESPRTRTYLRKTMPDLSLEAINSALDHLDQLGLTFEDAGKILSLALPLSEVQPRRHWWDLYETRWQRVEFNSEVPVPAT